MSMRQSSTYVWSVTDLLGQGATGNVFTCRNKSNGRPYAAKVFNSMGQMRTREVRVREIELLRKLSHENVVTLVAEEFEMNTRAVVLIMELCDTSLYNILELPENYFGLSEIEFKCVLMDVARGMKYLREHNVVHRDVKPGNILRIKSSTGTSVYKLTDFGAARQLQDFDQSFMSVYGTEEYLHPDVYEKAVMKNFSKKKKFTAAVDLWSMGVTFYHAATGQLPFRPYGGRQNKETMFEIISKKGPKVISGIQKASGGRIDYDCDLPEETRISKGLKNLLRPILQELLETTGEGLENPITFEQFHKQVEDIVSRKVIDVFCTNTSTWHKIYMKGEDNINVLQATIAAQTGLSIENQHAFMLKQEFKPSAFRTVNELPSLSKKNPLIVVGGEAIQSSKLYQRKIPNLPKMPGGKTRPENDIDVLKIYASVVYVYMFCAEDFFYCIQATENIFNIIMNLFNSKLVNIHQILKQLEGMKLIADQLTFKSRRELTMIKTILHSLRMKDNFHSDNDEMASGSHAKSDNLQHLQQLIDDGKVFHSLEKITIPDVNPTQMAKNWINEIQILAHEINDIFVNLSKEKFINRSIIEDLIYSAKKQQIIEGLDTIKSRFNSLAEVREDYHVKFNKWLMQIGDKFKKILKTDDAFKSIDAVMTGKICSEEMDSISSEKFALLQELENITGSKGNVQSFASNIGLNIMEAEVSSLETILQDILTLVKEGDQKLMSSKEIFEELSTCDS